MKVHEHKYMSHGGVKPKLAKARKVYGDECVTPGLITPHKHIFSSAVHHGGYKMHHEGGRKKAAKGY